MFLESVYIVKCLAFMHFGNVTVWHFPQDNFPFAQRRASSETSRMNASLQAGLCAGVCLQREFNSPIVMHRLHFEIKTLQHKKPDINMANVPF